MYTDELTRIRKNRGINSIKILQERLDEISLRLYRNDVYIDK